MYLVLNVGQCDKMNVPYVYMAYIRCSLNVLVARMHGLVAIVLGLCIFHCLRVHA